MSVDYKGHERSGYLSRVTKVHDGKQYIVFTVPVAARAANFDGEWQTAVLKTGFFGALIGAFRPLLTYDGLTDQNASSVHDQIVQLVDQYRPDLWRVFRHTKVSRYKT